ncbi:hypothetical protein [Dyadobacter sp. 50-39]|uniref:hypothetical protein n=1 Tax=Dyadobacter sp. 50-39 TaxID=1895756 RepID=UPI0025C55976|nr:hypothetical protein [Dyadobacter sp. 50-39]
MEKQKMGSEEFNIEDILAEREKIFEAIINSPFLNKKHQEADEYFSKLEPPFPWEKESLCKDA